MSTPDADHWDRVYETRGDHTSWHRPTLDRSLAIIDDLGLPAGSTAIDVGAGTSTLVDDLLARDVAEMTLVDLSRVALDTTRARLGDRTRDVRFVVGDVTKVELPAAAYDLWHDRAVFHFLTEPEQREAYVRQACHALRPDGRIVLATFGPRGPKQCSGLPVVRYDAATLHATLGTEAFHMIRDEREIHETPWGAEQDFLYCAFRRAPRGPAHP